MKFNYGYLAGNLSGVAAIAFAATGNIPGVSCALGFTALFMYMGYESEK